MPERQGAACRSYRQAVRLEGEDLTVHRRDGADFHVYHDPGPPPTFNGPLSEHYKWGFIFVSRWSSHLSPDDSVLIDIAPSGMGKLGSLPRRFEDYPGFYDPVPWGPGYRINPVTGRPYAPPIFPKAATSTSCCPPRQPHCPGPPRRVSLRAPGFDTTLGTRCSISSTTR